jgi:hypothetical protein
MKNQTALFIAVCIICVLCYRCTDSNSGTPAIDSALSENAMYAGYTNELEWGHHLVTVLGCGDCHTPKKMTAQGPVDDSSLLLSGHPSQVPAPQLLPEQIAKGLAATNDLTAWIGPWGYSFSANLTPDSTGIGNWTKDQFINALRNSKFKGLDNERPLMPPMPVNSYKNLTDAELSAVFTYLRSIHPVHNVVPDYQPPTRK